MVRFLWLMVYAALVAKLLGTKPAERPTAIKPRRHVRMLLRVQALYFTWCDRVAGSFRDTHRLIPGGEQEERKAA